MKKVQNNIKKNTSKKILKNICKCQLNFVPLYYRKTEQNNLNIYSHVNSNYNDS